MSTPDRKKKFVDPQVQGALVRRLILHWFGFFVTASIVSFILQMLSNPLIPLSAHLEELWWTQGPFLLVMVFLLPAFVLDTIKLSHRFAGPIYRLRQTIRSIADGNAPPRLKFRDFDFWQGLAEDFNKMIEQLNTHPTPAVEAEDESSKVASLSST
jgi:methyl-accepting chemotaxis protein